MLPPAKQKNELRVTSAGVFPFREPRSNRRFFAHWSLGVLAVLLATAAGAQQTQVLMMLEGSYAGIQVVAERVETTLRNGPMDLDILVESLDPIRFPEPGYEDAFAKFLRDKYADRPIGLVIAVGPTPLNFLTRYRTELFPGVPVVFGAVRESAVPSEQLLPNAQGVVSKFDVIETVNLALALQPAARHLIVLTGVAPMDLAWNAFARERLPAYADRLEVTYLEGEPIPQLLAQVAALPRDSIVLYLTMGRDRANEVFTDQLPLVNRISAAANAPVYAVYDIGVGEGIVGGYVESLTSIGADLGRLAVEVLAGEHADSPPVRIAATPQWEVDARQLRRWDLDEARLPAGTVVRFREPSLWSQYRGAILGVAAFIVFQTMLIILLVMRARERRMGHALQETEHRYRNVVEAQTDLICRYLPDTTLTFVNDAYCRYFGRTREELVGRKFLDLLPEADREAALQHLQGLVANPRTETNTHRVTRPDGTIGWQQWADHVIVDKHDPRKVEIQGIGRDVTQLKLAEGEAQQRREQVTHLTRVAILGELSGALAHELNQPLAAILSNAQAAQLLLDEGAIDRAELQDILRDIVADDIRAGQVISRLRALLKRGDRKLESVCMNEVVRDVLALARSQLVERHVAVIDEPSSNLPPVLGDRVQLQQVLLNVIMNASDALSTNDPSDRVVRVSTAYLDGVVRVSVADNGTGLPPDVAERLFEPFVTTKTNGMGLGLSICRSIIGAHGGRLSGNNNPGRGAEFAFTLPLVAS